MCPASPAAVFRVFQRCPNDSLSGIFLFDTLHFVKHVAIWRCVVHIVMRTGWKMNPSEAGQCALPYARSRHVPTFRSPNSRCQLPPKAADLSPFLPRSVRLDISVIRRPDTHRRTFRKPDAVIFVLEMREP